MTTMPIPEYEHTFRNEDNKLFRHEGYVVSLCKRCRQPFLIARSMAGRFLYCGQLACGG
jgi:hypothetical protein